MLRKLALCLSLSCGPLAAETVTVDTYRGPVEVETMPKRIAVLDVAALDTLAALGVTPAGVIDPIYVTYLGGATKGAEKVGTLFEPDFEAVAALAPDLIVAGGRSYEAVPDLARIAPTIDMTIWEDVVAQGLDRLAAYGEIFGKQDEAAALAAGFEEKLAATRAAVAGKGSALIVMTVGPKVSAYGSGGRFGWLHDALDLPEAVQSVEDATHGKAISFEFIRDADPEILIVVDRQAAIGQGGEAAKATLDNALVRKTRAWKNGPVMYLDSAPLYVAGGGIQSMSITLDQIAAGMTGS
ncbi:iron ABC transporter substrate-binding protein [Sulfitobacter alexandrii]|uniref:Iron ABC transporter substrate-binding protein n=1 Tax=Sulfitobacter alexandrii TaxID=1917485 RepID=A0A1J0WDV8_9RHOB|nr:siderophore ABC transporter substrate-binding protein [Sulfitobacter alexandrii]APE42368.1 iron ABC transporter substrate-binding protein [Sulfitobacter alexandrii]